MDNFILFFNIDDEKQLQGSHMHAMNYEMRFQQVWPWLWWGVIDQQVFQTTSPNPTTEAVATTNNKKEKTKASKNEIVYGPTIYSKSEDKVT